METVGNRSVTDTVVDSPAWRRDMAKANGKSVNMGAGKHWTWMKLHVGGDEQTQQIKVISLITNAVDHTEVDALLKQLKKPVRSLRCDGAYDKKKVRKQLKARTSSRSILDSTMPQSAMGSMIIWIKETGI